MPEMLDIVDENGVPTGQSVPRTTAHAEGLRHRTSHVWIVRRKNGRVQVLLQMRCAAKDSYPGCYDISSAGHIPAGAEFVGSALRELREELGVNTTCGASNISFGLPQRHGINAAFLPMAIGAGMTSAIMNPVRQVEMEAIRAANFLMNHDANGGEWIRFSKVIEAVEQGATFAEASAAATQSAGGRRGGRRGRG